VIHGVEERGTHTWNESYTGDGVSPITFILPTIRLQTTKGL